MEDDGSPFGGGGGPVEADETFFGQNPEAPKNRMPIRNMNAVVTLVDRSSGRARSVVMKKLDSIEITNILRENLADHARLYTDEAKHYIKPGKTYAEHQTVNHARGEFYHPEDVTIHTQTVENYYSVFKRGMRGTYQHCARKHLHRYCAEFDFRYSTRARLGFDDVMRSEALVKQVVGKRLTYQTTRQRTEGEEAAQGQA